jgi:hypothetical protein
MDFIRRHLYTTTTQLLSNVGDQNGDGVIMFDELDGLLTCRQPESLDLLELQEALEIMR